MSPRSFATQADQAVLDAERRLWLDLGTQFRDARMARRWSVVELARRASVSSAVVYLAESGRRRLSTEAVVRLARALGRRAEFELVDPRRRADGRRDLSVDVVHSAMGEFEAAHLRSAGYRVGIDEPYQHYQFAGRADVVAWDVAAGALLHIENRTRFPDLQEAAGSFNAKRAYLGAALGERLGIRRWESETHVIAALWSSEVLHAIRMREQTFRSLCPDAAETFDAWWTGQLPRHGRHSTLIVLDPLATGRRRTWIDLENALSARPRHSGYAGAAARFIASG